LLPQLRADAQRLVGAALAEVDAGALVARATSHATFESWWSRFRAVDVVAAGKAASPMLEALGFFLVRARTVVGVGPAGSLVPPGVQWFDGGHPVPNEGSLAGARRALEVARAAGPQDATLVLISGGGSALMALPADGLTLADKQRTIHVLLASGADIYELNTVRKHLSAIKGGRLAAAARGAVHTLIVSDVVGDDLSVIASGPTVPDESTFADAVDVLRRRGPEAAFPSAVVAHLGAGLRGEVSETPARSDAALARAFAEVIGRQRGALEGAEREAERLGYRVVVVPEPIIGEARDAARRYVERVAPLLASARGPLCVLSSGETTVTVRGTGRGGRNQEFACAAAPLLDRFERPALLASFGTDGIDGPTDAAGAIVDVDTVRRAQSIGLPPLTQYLGDNDTYALFDALGDLLRTGPTRTNVGDVQILLAP
jgi:glycerate 2-kinase